MKMKPLYQAVIYFSLAIPTAVSSQEVPQSRDVVDCSIKSNQNDPACVDVTDGRKVDEIVVTGSYLERDKAYFSSPIETITAIDIQAAGNSSLGQYIRDLTFTANTDTVANVLAFQDGQQDSNSARFNLRGLGVDSTLTLYNGERVVDSGNIGGVVPDIALSRIDIVMDGGSSLYGSDAVAGVVNLISIKKYDGFKVRTLYNVADGFEEPKVEMLFGNSFDNGLNLVASVSAGKKTTLTVAERPDYLRAYDDDTTQSSPGSWAVGMGSLSSSSSTLDPDCGAFNAGGNPNAQDFPSGYTARVDIGTVFTDLPRCVYHYARQQDVARANENLVGHLNLNYAVNDWLELNFEGNWTRRESQFRRSPVTQGRTVGVPGVGSFAGPFDPFGLNFPDGNPIAGFTTPHPANPFRSAFFGGQSFDVFSRSWVPFREVGTLPSHLTGDAAYIQPYHYDTDRYTLKADYDFGVSSWSGATTLSYQDSVTEIESYDISFSRMQKALVGYGGPNCSIAADLDWNDPADRAALAALNAQGQDGCEWFNPFGSADPRSPNYQAGVTDNSQALVDWLFIKDQYVSTRDELEYFQTLVKGDLLELPAGTMGAVFGAQRRKSTYLDGGSSLSLLGDDFQNDVARKDVEYVQTVNAFFTEFYLPVTNALSFDASARYEEYDEVDLKTTAPKIGLRYALSDTVTLRSSWAKSFVAPRGNQLTVSQPDNCVELQLTQDVVPGGGINGETCPSGNPDLEEQESTIRNFGISWRPAEDLSISLDYQQLTYKDRIVNLSAQDVVDIDGLRFERALDGGQLTDINSDGVIDAIDWANSGLGHAFIERDPANGLLTRINRHPANASHQEIHSFDLRVRNGFEWSDLGYFAQVLSVTAYKKYEFEDFDGSTGKAVGNRNADSNLAPPIPRYRANLNLSWLRDNHSAQVIVSYLDDIKFDGQTDTLGVETRPDDPSIPLAYPAPDRLPSYTEVDLRYGYTFPQLLDGTLDFAFGVQNLFDKMPEALPVVGGFETRLYDNFGRRYYVDLTYEF